MDGDPQLFTNGLFSWSRVRMPSQRTSQKWLKSWIRILASTTAQTRRTRNRAMATTKIKTRQLRHRSVSRRTAKKMALTKKLVKIRRRMMMTRFSWRSLVRRKRLTKPTSPVTPNLPALCSHKSQLSQRSQRGTTRSWTLCATSYTKTRTRNQF